MMTTSTSEALKIAERLLASARAWGKENGYDRGVLWINKDGTWRFGYYNTSNKQELTKLPERIAHAFAKYAKAIDIFAASRLHEDRMYKLTINQSSQPTPGAIGSSSFSSPPDQKRDDGDECDCHGGTWSNSPIKSNGSGVEKTGENQGVKQ